MLEGVLIVRHIIIIVVRVSEEGITIGENIRGTQIGRWQLCLVRFLDGEYFLGIVCQILAQLVAQVGICVAVAYNLDRL